MSTVGIIGYGWAATAHIDAIKAACEELAFFLDHGIAFKVIDAASATVTYVCEAQAVGTATSAAAWRIKRITVAGNVTTIQWGGTGAFDQIADNRATTVVYA